MPISIVINGQNAHEALLELRTLAGSLAPVPGVQPPDAPESAAGSDAPTATAEVPAAGPKPGRKKAPAAEAVIEQPPATDAPAAYTIDEVREMSRAWSSAGHMDQIAEAMVSFKVKKMSEIDPEHDGKKSEKFGAYVAKIEELIATKKAAG